MRLIIWIYRYFKYYRKEEYVSANWIREHAMDEDSSDF